MENTKQVYISIQPVVKEELVCTHPKVKMMWQTGGMSANPLDDSFYVTTHLEFNNGERKQFTDKDPQKSVDKANEFLNQI